MSTKYPLRIALAVAACMLITGIAPARAAEHVKIGVVRSMGGAPLYVAQGYGLL